ncbi:zinc ribbon domain-containing protein [Methanobrevibacter millerae]|uniref:Uncharacterized protein n=1 Tax=Methanobrevibacter millerae TaxID=230361 RepID=A0A1G5X9H4_9EURY|nr:zinc ribbon domain-containing protein [Methanobrevibacter millerae]SDA66576.1 hypothetical protein SAMN02910315_02019 [Methanobrevibacter millerae]
MKSINFVVRKDRKAVTIHDDGFINAVKLLKKDYPYILNAIKKEDYVMEEVEGDYFKEILFEDKVVGFAVYENTNIGLISLVQVYILPEFRGNRLFLNEILSIYKRGIELSILQPTRNLVDILMHYGLAKKVRDNIAVSAIVFEIPSYSIESNVDSYRDPMKYYLSSFYLTDICSPFIVEGILESGECLINYSMFLDWDDELYDCIETREELISEKYFAGIADFFLNNQELFINTVIEMKEQLPICEEGFRSIVASDEGLSNYMENMVDNGVLSQKRAFEIKDQLYYEYGQGMVTDEGLLTRLYFLIDDDVREITEEELYELLASDDVICPYCFANWDSSNRFCPNCGFNLYYDEPDDMDFEDDLPLGPMDEDEIALYFAQFVKHLVEESDVRETLIQSGEFDESFEEFFNIIEGDSQLKDYIINVKIDENFSQNEFFERISESIPDDVQFRYYFKE